MNMAVRASAFYGKLNGMKHFARWGKYPGFLSALGLVLASAILACAPSSAGPSATSGQVNLGSVYDSSTYGFSIRFPSDWSKKETGQSQPVVEIRAPAQFPLVTVSISYVTSVTTVKDEATSALGAQKGSLTNFAQVSEGDLTIGGVPAYSIEFTWMSGNTPAKARIVTVLRGSELYEIDVIAPQNLYDASKQTTDAIVASLQVKEPQPFGLSRSQSLTLADQGPQTMDPALSRESGSMQYIQQVFSGLVTYDKDMNLLADIADHWDISQDGRTYTFYLKHNVKFHNGKQVTASDFKYSWERAANPQTGSQTASTYLGDVVGVTDMLAGKATSLSGVKVIDDYTLQVTIDSPKSYFLSKLYYPVAYVVDKQNVQSGGKEWWRQPNGTGPFKLKQWLQDELVILEKNTDYYRQPASLNAIVFRLFQGIPLMMYQTGDIDVTGIGGANIDTAKDSSNPLSKELRISPELSFYYLDFNFTKPPFDDPMVRKAFVEAIDRAKVVQRTTNGTLPKADGIVPPGMPGYEPQVKPLPFDPAQARADLAASKYKDAAHLPPITVTVDGDGGDVTSSLGAVIDQWRVNLGVDVGVRLLDPKLFFNNLRKEKNELYNSGWIADYPDPQNFLDILFRTGGEENVGEYHNPDIDALLDQAAGEKDVNKRMSLYHQVEQKLIDDSAVIPLTFGREYYLVKPYVNGYVVSPLGIPAYSQVAIQPH